MIKQNNIFNHNKRKCFASFEFNDKEVENEIDSLDRIFKVVSNIYYLLSMAVTLSILIPAFLMICRYELFSKLISKLSKMLSSSDLEENLKLLEMNIKMKKGKLVKIDQTNLVYLRKFQNLNTETLKLKLFKEKIQDELSMMQQKYKELQLSKAHKKIHPSFVEIGVPENDHQEGELK